MWKLIIKMSLLNILYEGKVIGRNGKPLTIYKIRTMSLDAHEQEALVQKCNGIDELGKIVNDPRITSLGKLLRKYWIDEIPQIYNLCCGELSLVGIRPRTVDKWKLFSDEHKEKALRYKPGLMGIHYAFPDIKNFNDFIEIDKIYLDEKDKFPILTDIKYFFRILYAILFKGVRSR